MWLNHDLNQIMIWICPSLLAAQILHGGSSAFQPGNLPFYELCSPETQNRTNRPARHHLHDVHKDCPLAPKHMAVTKDMLSHYITVEMRRRKRHARDAPFVEYRTACGRRIGICG